MFLLIVILIAGSILLLCFALIPLFEARINAWKEKKEKKITAQLDNLFYAKTPQEILRLYFILPPALSFAGFFFFVSVAES